MHLTVSIHDSGIAKFDAAGDVSTSVYALISKLAPFCNAFSTDAQQPIHRRRH